MLIASQDEIAQFCERLGFPQDPEAALRLSHAVFKAMGQGPELLAPLPSVDEAVAMGIEDDIPETEQLYGNCDVACGRFSAPHRPAHAV